MIVMDTAPKHAYVGIRYDVSIQTITRVLGVRCSRKKNVAKLQTTY